MAASASGVKGTDFYRILNVSRTATTVEIKKAYRKLAMSLHPDRHDGDTAKVDAFKAASEAYNTLSDHSKRTEYDQWFSNSSRHSYNFNGTTAAASPKRRPPPPNYRKVYIPRPPPGVKAFDDQRHFDMHYGDGMMREELERVRRELERENEEQFGKQRNNSSPFGHYESPLGQGFTFTSEHDHNPYSKRSPQGPPPRGIDMSHVEYEEVHFYDYQGGRSSSDMMSSRARHVTNARDSIRDRLEERRQERILKGQRPHAHPHNHADESGCSIM